jgi:hypothetical protein
MASERALKGGISSPAILPAGVEACKKRKLLSKQRIMKYKTHTPDFPQTAQASA